MILVVTFLANQQRVVIRTWASTVADPCFFSCSMKASGPSRRLFTKELVSMLVLLGEDFLTVSQSKLPHCKKSKRARAKH
eukprot:3595296-Rhodomonas_salina.2